MAFVLLVGKHHSSVTLIRIFFAVLYRYEELDSAAAVFDYPAANAQTFQRHTLLPLFLFTGLSDRFYFDRYLRVFSFRRAGQFFAFTRSQIERGETFCFLRKSNQEFRGMN